MATDTRDRRVLRNVARRVQSRDTATLRVQTASERLRAEIRSAREAGFTLREIGEAAGLSRQRIHELSEL